MTEVTNPTKLHIKNVINCNSLIDWIHNTRFQKQDDLRSNETRDKRTIMINGL